MKKLKYIVGAVALFALVVANVWNAATVNKMSCLAFMDVENIADGFEINANMKPMPTSGWGGGEPSKKYWSDYLPGSNWKNNSVHVHCELDQVVNGTPEHKVMDFDVVQCGNGAGDCWWSDDTDCLKLMQR